MNIGRLSQKPIFISAELRFKRAKRAFLLTMIIKLIHLVGISFTFQLIFRKLFVNGEKTLFLRNFKKKFEVNGELYIILTPS